MYTGISELLSAIVPVDRRYFGAAQTHLDGLTKPQGSLGRLEEIAARLFVISRSRDKSQAGVQTPLSVLPATLFIAGGDHGIWAEKVSPHPQEVTHQMMLNILAGGAASSVLAREAGMDILVLDAGHKGGHIAPDHAPGQKQEQRRLAEIGERPETGNLAREPAMSEALCERLILRGASLTLEAAGRGMRLAATGEMGIANTSPATALYCAFFGLSPRDITGPGTGLSPEGVRHKAEVIEAALKLHAPVVASRDPLAILAALGGFEIAALTGVILGAAAARLPVLIDGFIASSAYAAARALCPAVADYAFLSHSSAEPGFQAVAEALGQKPLLDLGMRLGEGTGCAAVLPLLKAAAAIFNDMASFTSAGVTSEREE